MATTKSIAPETIESVAAEVAAGSYTPPAQGPVMNEPVRHYHSLLSEGNGAISREAVKFAAGAGVIVANTVLSGDSAAGFAPLASGGVATAICMQTIDATSADASATCIVRLAEIKKDALVFGFEATDADKAKAYADLASKAAIIAR